MLTDVSCGVLWLILILMVHGSQLEILMLCLELMKHLEHGLWLNAKILQLLFLV